jgi:SNF2 family DNA or RNA helicase
MVDGGALVAASKLVRSGRLSQLASAWAEVDWDNDGLPAVTLAEPSCKADALEELVADMGGAQLVVFAESRQLVDLCAARLGRRGVDHCLVTGAVAGPDRAAAIDAFQAGRRQVILLTFGAGAEGITLTAAPTVAFLQRAWSSTKNLQAEDRIHRPGAERWPSVHVVDLVTRGTIDERRLALVAEKGDVLEDLLQDEATLRRLLG